MALTIEDVRGFLRDHMRENRLTDEVDFSNESIGRAIKFTVSDFNETPVPTAFSVENFPWVSTLLYGAAAYLLEGLSVLQVRNHLPYNVGGVAIDDSNKGGEYSGLSARFRQVYEDKKRQIKNYINLEQGWGNSLSEYFSNNMSW